ncbi:hypothetical protein RJ639_006640 [Escallonia herrerae]|uniref:F-box domain-containing protein n=1 Tax=Escallonia herrerae TaxID=1293975 RepID=A0AA88W1I3_9ASTE|nr:hypothetical protein RJ639_006640 [Escallonia herrerae]
MKAIKLQSTATISSHTSDTDKRLDNSFPLQDDPKLIKTSPEKPLSLSLSSKPSPPSSRLSIPVSTTLVQFMSPAYSMKELAATMTLPSPKVAAKDEDRISNLPDEILHDILSCLPTKDAVGTCVLSRRWQFVWTHISGIDLEDDNNNNDPLQLERTMLFVDKLLNCRNVNINKVCLHFREGADPLGVYMWISSAIVRKVEELCINITVENVVLPHCIFTCVSLTVLKLDIECIVKPPNAVFLPNLKILHLTSAIFPDDSSSQKLFCSFPVLKSYR